MPHGADDVKAVSDYFCVKTNYGNCTKFKHCKKVVKDKFTLILTVVPHFCPLDTTHH